MPSLWGLPGHLMAGRLNGTSWPGRCAVVAAARTLWSAAQSRHRSLPVPSPWQAGASTSQAGHASSDLPPHASARSRQPRLAPTVRHQRSGRAGPGRSPDGVRTDRVAFRAVWLADRVPCAADRVAPAVPPARPRRSGTSGPVRDQGTGPVPDQSASDAGLPVLRSERRPACASGRPCLTSPPRARVVNNAGWRTHRATSRSDGCPR